MHAVSNITHASRATTVTAHATSTASAPRHGVDQSFADMMSVLNKKAAAASNTAAASTTPTDAESSSPAQGASKTAPAAATAQTATADATKASAASASGADPAGTAAGSPTPRGKHADGSDTTADDTDPVTAVATSLLALDPLQMGLAVPKAPDGSLQPSSVAALHPAGAGGRAASSDAGTAAIPAAEGQADPSTPVSATTQAGAASGPGTNDPANTNVADASSPAAAAAPDTARPDAARPDNARPDADGAPPAAASASQADAPANVAAGSGHAAAAASSPQPTDPTQANAAPLPEIPPGGSFAAHTPAFTATPASAGTSPGPERASTPGSVADADMSDPALHAPSAYSASVTTSDAAGTAIRVDAGDLGTIEVTLGKSENGTAAVTVAADRADTLAVMAADRDQMQSVLAQVGIEASGRHIEYTMLTGNDTAAMASAWSGGGHGAGNGQGEDDGHARGAFSAWGNGGNSAGLSQDGAQPRSTVKTVYTRRTSVDITA